MSDTNEQQPAPAVKRRRGRLRAPNGEHRYTPFTVYLDPALAAALDAQAVAEGVGGRSDVVRAACREYLRRAAKRRPEGDELARLLLAVADDAPELAAFTASLVRHAAPRKPKGNTP